MWISNATVAMMKAHAEDINETRKQMAEAIGRNRQLEFENQRMRADIDWFKLRLNQVERERGQLIQAAIGVKIAVPEFVPTYEDPASALNAMPDLSTVGMDARPDTVAEQAEGVDYSMMPGYRGTR